MMKAEDNELKERIRKEMLVDYSGLLDRNFNLAKKFIGITDKGTINIRNKDDLNGKDQILLYLIGKIYAKEVGLVDSEYVGNKELKNELGIPKGSLYPWLKDLRDSNIIEKTRKENRSYHRIPVNRVEETLKSIEKKVGESR